MTLRWFGNGYDTVSLKQIRQIPGVSGVISTLYGTKPGELWGREEIHRLKQSVENEGLTLAGIESLNVHEDIKSGKGRRDEYIESYIKSLRNLGEEGIRLVTYNFMPVFDWTRTELERKRPDGSTVLAYTQEAVNSTDPKEMFAALADSKRTSSLPGWEAHRMETLRDSFQDYEDVDRETLMKNLEYFLKSILPVCEKYELRMALHPDDPAWSVFGLPRIVNSKENIERILALDNSPCHGLAFCSGSLGSSLGNDIPAMIRSFGKRIYFAHIRNLRFHSPDDFEEAAHISTDGSLDMYEIMKALYDVGFDGPIRPDHGRMIWDEQAMPGYGLYDRALGASYLLGLWEAIEKGEQKYA